MANRARSNSRFLKHRSKPAAGAFTIIEVLICVAVSALLITVLWRLFSNTFTSVKSGTGHVHLTRHFRLAMMYFKDDIDNATALEITGNKDDAILLKRISGIDASGNPAFRDITYSNINGEIKREENGKKTIIGDNKQVEINFTAKKICFDEHDYSKYEVSVLLSGKNLKKLDEMDSIEIIATPQMMIKNKTMNWMPNPALKNN